MMAASPEPPRFALESNLTHQVADSKLCRDYVPLANLIGIIFQIRDDYVNLQSAEVSRSSRRKTARDRQLTAGHYACTAVRQQQGLLRGLLRGQVLVPHRPLDPRGHDKSTDPE